MGFIVLLFSLLLLFELRVLGLGLIATYNLDIYLTPFFFLFTFLVLYNMTVIQPLPRAWARRKVKIFAT